MAADDHTPSASSSGQLGGKDDVRQVKGPRLDTSSPESSAAQGRGQEHVRHLLAAEYARCTNLVENCDREIAKSKEAISEWEKERRKWAERASAVHAELGGDIPYIPPRAQSELTDAWEFESRV